MTDQSTSNTQPPDGLIGLATSLGALRSDLSHHIEDQNRTFAELRSEQAERVDAIEATVNDLHSRLVTLADLVAQSIAAIEASVSRNNDTKNKTTTTATSTTPPARERGESNTKYHTRLVAWAEKHGVATPPKAKSGPMAPSAATYDKLVSEWKRSLEP